MLAHARFNELFVLSVVLNRTTVNRSCSWCSMSFYLSPNMTHKAITGLVPCHTKIIVSCVVPYNPTYLMNYIYNRVPRWRPLPVPSQRGSRLPQVPTRALTSDLSIPFVQTTDHNQKVNWKKSSHHPRIRVFRTPDFSLPLHNFLLARIAPFRTVNSVGGGAFHGAAGVKAGAAAVQGMRGDEDRGQARMLVPQDAHGEEQTLCRRPSHHWQVQGPLQAALLHPTR